MTHRSIRKSALATALVASVAAASPAIAKPMDPATAYGGDRSGAPTGSLAGTTDPQVEQDLRGERAQDAARQHIAPGQPTWPANPQPLPKPASPVTAASAGDGDGGDGIWLVLGLGLAGAGIVAGGAAGIARHTRVRARRVAV